MKDFYDWGSIFIQRFYWCGTINVLARQLEGAPSDCADWDTFMKHTTGIAERSGVESLSQALERMASGSAQDAAL